MDRLLFDIRVDDKRDFFVQLIGEERRKIFGQR